MTARQPPVEVTSTKSVYLEEGGALPLPGTQCIYTGIEREQMCFGNNHPTRIRLQPDKSLKFGLSPQSISQLKYNSSFPSSLPESLPESLPGQIIFPGLDPEARSIAMRIQQGDERQRKITETARQNRQLWLLRSCGEYMDGVAGEYAEEENETTGWWILEEALYEADDSNEAKIRYEDLIHEGIPLKSDTSYCITPPSHNKTRINSDVPCDDESDNENRKSQVTPQENPDSEDDTSPDEKSDNNSKEAVRSVADSDCIITNVEPGFEVAPEIAAYCDALEWAAFKQEPESDDEIPIDSEVVTAEAQSTIDDLASPSPAKKRKLSGHLEKRIEAVHKGKKKHVCDWTGANGQRCNQAFGLKGDLNRHIVIVHEGKKKHVCDKTGVNGQPCHKAFGQKSNLKRHIEIVHEGKKEHVCDKTGADGHPCNKAFGQKYNLKTHMQTVHKGKREHVCNWTGADGQPCNQTFDQKIGLKRHIRFIHEGDKNHICDRIGADGQPCNQTFAWKSYLKTHMETVHEGKREHVCDRTGANGQPCNKAFSLKGNLNKHIRTVHGGKQKNRKRPRIEEADDQIADSQQHGREN